jgi:hypothetical protein
MKIKLSYCFIAVQYIELKNKLYHEGGYKPHEQNGQTICIPNYFNLENT